MFQIKHNKHYIEVSRLPDDNHLHQNKPSMTARKSSCTCSYGPTPVAVVVAIEPLNISKITNTKSRGRADMTRNPYLTVPWRRQKHTSPEDKLEEEAPWSSRVLYLQGLKKKLIKTTSQSEGTMIHHLITAHRSGRRKWGESMDLPRNLGEEILPKPPRERRENAWAYMVTSRRTICKYVGSTLNGLSWVKP